MASGLLFFIFGLVPLSFIIAFCGLELAISLIQAQVFVVLTSSYIKDALELHGGHSSSKTKVEVSSTFTPNIKRRIPTSLKLDQRRSYSTLPSKPKGVKYNNADTDKLLILSENKAKAGVYMWTHVKSRKCYIGSSVNLRRRFLEYYNTERLLKSFSMIINRALLKYGYSAFSLEILVYCNRNELMKEEKYYIDLFNPE
jgi:hypothetical protein